MRRRTLTVVALAVAVAALGATIAYAVSHGSGGGMMSRSGYSTMGTSGNRSAWYLDGSGRVADIAAARTQAQRFADRIGLKTGEVIQFTNNFYVRLNDRQGAPATEVLVDPRSGDLTLEYGAAMMWNTRYAMMRGTMVGRGGMMGGSTAGGGMMGGSTAGGGMMGRHGAGSAAGSGPVDAAGARAAADRWLTAQGLDARAGEPDAFPGYYTMETQRDGNVTGMLSVNAQTGAVLYHWWHGRFVAAEG